MILLNVIFVGYRLNFCSGLQDLLPDIIHQIGPDAIPSLKKIAEGLSQAKAGSSSSGSDAPAPENDDDIPPLVDASE